MSLDPDLLYEECPVCETAGEVDGGPCVWCGGEGLVEHECG